MALGHPLTPQIERQQCSIAAARHREATGGNGSRALVRSQRERSLIDPRRRPLNAHPPDRQ